MSPQPPGACLRCGFHRVAAGGACPVCRAVTEVLPELPTADSVPLVEGSVIQVDRRAEERDFSVWRLLGWILAAVAALFVGVAALVLLLVIGIFFRRLPGLPNLWTLLLFRRSGETPHHQVLEIHLVEDGGAEILAVLKAKRLTGSVQQGHRIQLWGDVRRGIVRVHRGYNLTTRSAFGPAGWFA